MPDPPYYIWPYWVQQQLGTTTYATNVVTGGGQGQVWPYWVGTQQINVNVVVSNYSYIGYPPVPQSHVGNKRSVLITQSRVRASGLRKKFPIRQHLPLTLRQRYECQLQAQKRAKWELRQYDLILRNRDRSSRLRVKIASRRAELLLLEHLNDKQKKEWREHHYFHVETGGGHRVYRISKGLAGNVRLVKCSHVPLKFKKRLHRGSTFCMHVYHPEGAVPTEDNVLAQKLLIEADEKEFISLANVS